MLDNKTKLFAVIGKQNSLTELPSLDYSWSHGGKQVFQVSQQYHKGLSRYFDFTQIQCIF